jgi:hypothetical protein
MPTEFYRVQACHHSSLQSPQIEFVSLTSKCNAHIFIWDR